MTEAAAFVAAFLGSLTGMLAGVIPVVWYVKKKLSKSPMGAVFG